MSDVLPDVLSLVPQSTLDALKKAGDDMKRAEEILNVMESANLPVKELREWFNGLKTQSDILTQGLDSIKRK